MGRVGRADDGNRLKGATLFGIRQFGDTEMLTLYIHLEAYYEPTVDGDGIEPALVSDTRLPQEPLLQVAIGVLWLWERYRQGGSEHSGESFDEPADKS